MRRELMAAALAVVGVSASADRAAAQIYTYPYNYPPAAVYSYPYTFPPPVAPVYPGPVVYTSPTYPLVRTYSTPVVYSTYTAPVIIPTRMWVVTPQAAVTPAGAVVADATVSTAGTAVAATAGGLAVTAGGVATAAALTTNLDGARVIGPVVAGPPVFQLGHTTYTPIVAPVAAPYVAGTTGAAYYYSPYGYGTYNALSGPYMSVGFGRGYGGWGWGRGWGYASWGYQW